MAFGTSRPAEISELTTMRCLRLANAFLPFNQELKKDVVTQIRLDRNAPGWEEICGRQFDVLPECVKHDVIGRYTYTRDF